MPIDIEEVAKEVFPISLQKREEKGKEEGKKAEKQTVAKKMLAKSCDIAFIVEVTGLSADEIRQLKA